jgi:ubiquinol-cytochrome c reductase core subunit 2
MLLSGNPVKYGSGASKLNQAVLGAGAVSALNMNYSDAGLFGFVAAAPAGDAGKVVSAAAKVLRSVKIDETQLTRAKKQLKADILMAQENTSHLLEELSSPNRSVDLLEAISKLSVADVNGAAAHLASAKLAVAAVGNLANVPFADEL